MPSLLTLLVAALSLAATSHADSAATCSRGSKCPQDKPCCSQYGQCGTGAYCLGGCDPFSSYSLDACMPAPVCRSQDMKLTSVDDIISNTKYLGNASAGNWVSSGSPQKYTDADGDQILLTMPKGSVGTLLASTTYVWYGKITAKLKTSRTQGVVTAFILLGDSKDEIDFEFVGTELNTAQSNFYFQGQPNYSNSKNLSVTDTFDTYHEYTIDWTPDQVVWSIDGKELRTLKRSDTWNSTDNTFHFPQSPSRIQLSLWPAGSPSNAKGTVDWAGGLIDWDSYDVQKWGYFYAMFQEINVQCYEPPSNANISSKDHQVSYVYTSDAGTNNTVSITDKGTVMKSFLDSGLNPDANAPSNDSPEPTAVGDGTVPGMEGGGVRSGGDSGSDSGSSGGSGSGGGGSNGYGGSGGGSGSPMPTIGGFTQGRTSGAAAVGHGEERVLRGSFLAVLVAIAGVMLM